MTLNPTLFKVPREILEYITHGIGLHLAHLLVFRYKPTLVKMILYRGDLLIVRIYDRSLARE